MITRCPGQDPRYLKAELIKCAGCGIDVEIFSDEIKVLCPGCKAQVHRNRPRSCLDWCKFAALCKY